MAIFSKLLKSHSSHGNGSTSPNGSGEHAPGKKDFEFGPELGHGAFGVVKRAHRKGAEEGVDVAIKKVKKKLVAPDKEALRIRQAAIENLRSFDHPHIVNLIEHFTTKNSIFVVYEYYKGHELFDRIVEHGKLSEADSRLATLALVDALKYLHDRNVIHRDIKPENILMRSDHGPADDLVLADFGLAVTAPTPPDKLFAVCGSPGYAAPEIYRRTGYSKPVDLWSTGVVVYAMLSGRSPFKSSETPDLIQECKEGKVAFPDRYWKSLSAESLDFVKKLLTVDPDERMTAEQALAHPWLANPPATATKDDAEPLSAASDASLPDLARQDAASGEVKRQPTLREVAPGQHVRANSEAMPDDTDTAHPQLASCPSWRFMPNCSKSSAKGVKDIKLPAGTKFEDSDGSSSELPPSLVQSLNDNSDTDSPGPSQPQTRRSSYADVHAQQTNADAIKSKLEDMSIGQGGDVKETISRSPE